MHNCAIWREHSPNCNPSIHSRELNSTPTLIFYLFIKIVGNYFRLVHQNIFEGTSENTSKLHIKWCHELYFIPSNVIRFYKISKFK